MCLHTLFHMYIYIYSTLYVYTVYQDPLHGAAARATFLATLLQRKTLSGLFGGPRKQVKHWKHGETCWDTVQRCQCMNTSDSRLVVPIFLENYVVVTRTFPPEARFHFRHLTELPKGRHHKPWEQQRLHQIRQGAGRELHQNTAVHRFPYPHLNDSMI